MYLKAILITAFIAIWAGVLVDKMVLNEPKLTLENTLSQLEAARNDPDVKKKEKLLKIARDFEKHHLRRITKQPFELALERFLKKAHVAEWNSFLDADIKLVGVSDRKSLKTSAKVALGNVRYIPLKIKVEPSGGGMMSYTLFAQYLDLLLKSNQVLLSKLVLEPNAAEIGVDYLGTFK